MGRIVPKMRIVQPTMKIVIANGIAVAAMTWSVGLHELDIKTFIFIAAAAYIAKK